MRPPGRGARPGAAGRPRSGGARRRSAPGCRPARRRSRRAAASSVTAQSRCRLPSRAAKSATGAPAAASSIRSRSRSDALVDQQDRLQVGLRGAHQHGAVVDRTRHHVLVGEDRPARSPRAARPGRSGRGRWCRRRRTRRGTAPARRRRAGSALSRHFSSRSRTARYGRSNRRDRISRTMLRRFAASRSRTVSASSTSYGGEMTVPRSPTVAGSNRRPRNGPA